MQAGLRGRIFQAALTHGRGRMLELQTQPDLIYSGCYKTAFMSKISFYCAKKCGDPDFSIDEWNKALQYCEDAGLSESETNKILHPELFPCETQCEACMNIVLDTQIKNRKICEEQAKKAVL